MQCVAWTPVSLRSTTANWISFLPRQRIQRGRQTVPTSISVRRGLSQPAKPARTSPVQIRLASPTKNCGDSMHDPLKRALFGAMVSASPSASRRIRWKSDPVPWFRTLGRADSSSSGRTDSIYDSEPDLLKLGVGCVWILLSSCSRTGTSGSGTIPATESGCGRGPAEPLTGGAPRKYSIVSHKISEDSFLHAHVSDFLGPKQLFPSKQQIAHVSGSTCALNGGKEEEVSQAASGSPDTLFDSGPKLGEWDITIAGKYCPCTRDPAPLCLPLARLPLHEIICAHWCLPGSPLAKFD